MFAEMDFLLAHQRRGELVQEIDAGRLERRLRTGRRSGHERRWSLWLLREIEVATGMPFLQKIRRLQDAGSPKQT